MTQTQTVRAYRIVNLPLLVNAIALWGVGLGGGYLFAFNVGGEVPSGLRGAQGFWSAATLALIVAALNRPLASAVPDPWLSMM